MGPFIYRLAAWIACILSLATIFLPFTWPITYNAIQGTQIKKYLKKTFKRSKQQTCRCRV
jgi:hypothetical protein